MSNQVLHIGEKVRCVDASGAPLTEGAVYTVKLFCGPGHGGEGRDEGKDDKGRRTGMSPHPAICVDGVNGLFKASRFEAS